MAELRTLIDFATGENWDMPLSLYERYEKDVVLRRKTNQPLCKNTTFIQYWISTLDEEDKAQIRKK